jgi:protein involved in polysaccharide export with SLBB domain
MSIAEPTQNGSPNPDMLNVSTANDGFSTATTYLDRAVPEDRIGTILRSSKPKQSDPLTEFQRFVVASTGQVLPIFGASLFGPQPTSFGPIANAPAPPDLIIGPDDELRIRIWGQVNVSANLRVSREGEVYLPKVGAVHVAGLAYSAVPSHLRTALERIYRNFELSVDLGEIHSIAIYITGRAWRPGEYTISALSTLVDAIFASGGPSAAGSMRHVLLKREGKIVNDFDLYALLVKGDKTGDAELQPGDVLYIPAVGPQVALLGSVHLAGIYELRGQESIKDLLDLAGDRTAIASGAQLSLERIEDRTRRRAFEMKEDSEGLGTLLADGDIVRIDPILSNYRDAVTLRGAVANPGRFRWHEGMRLSEVLPDRDSLEKRDYWWHRTQLGLPSSGFASDISSVDRTDKLVMVESPAEQTNWNSAVIERLDPSTMTTSLLHFGLGKLVLDHDPSEDLTLRAGDVITIFSQSDIQIPIDEQTTYVKLEGEVLHPGIYSISPSETLPTVVQRAGGLTKQAYLYAAVFTRKSTQVLEQKQLNEAADRLEHQLLRNSLTSVHGLYSTDSQQAQATNRELIERLRSVQATGRIVLNMNLSSGGNYKLPEMHLEDGDKLIIPHTPETVQVLGAVPNPHAFLFNRKAKLGDYLHLAGGPTREADSKRMFVLRADGTVTIPDSKRSIFESGFDDLRLNPGDSIIIPEKVPRPSSMSQVLAWSQALPQASLTALELAALSK